MTQEGYATQIRQFVRNRIIEPARERNEKAVLIRVGDVRESMGLGSERLSDICGALQRPVFEDEARVKLVYASLFPYQGAERELIFKVMP